MRKLGQMVSNCSDYHVGVVFWQQWITLVEVLDIRQKWCEVGRGPKEFWTVDTLPGSIDRLSWRGAKPTSWHAFPCNSSYRRLPELMLLRLSLSYNKTKKKLYFVDTIYVVALGPEWLKPVTARNATEFNIWKKNFAYQVITGCCYLDGNIFRTLFPE